VKKYIKLAVITGLIVIVDQASKAVILKQLPLYRSIPVIPGFFNMTHVQNPGGAFGLLAGQPSVLRNIVFILVSTLALGLVFYLYKTTPKTHPLPAFGFALIFGGAIGNLIDRVRFGKVVDFLDVYVGNLHWPAFNVADSAITIGIGIFLFCVVFKKLPD
jgi:signal peptidase II